MQAVQKPLSELSNREIGIIGENLVDAFAEDKNFEVLERNWTCVLGEVDRIYKDGDVLAFCEVKTRIKRADDDEELLPELAITAKKCEKYKKLIAAYLADHPEHTEARFDAAGITLESERIAHVHYISDIVMDEG